MAKFTIACGSILALLSVWLFVSASRTVVGREVRLTEGSSALTFLPSILVESKLKVDMSEPIGFDPAKVERSLDFEIGKADLQVRLVDGRLTEFQGGTVTHSGGFKLVSGERSIQVDDFRVFAKGNVEKTLGLEADIDGKPIVVFELLHPRVIFDGKTQQIALGSMDVVLTRAAAEALGRIDLKGKLLGQMSVYADTDPTDGGGDVVVPLYAEVEAESNVLDDVAISDLTSLSVVGRVGTYPNGKVGMSMLTESCNVGTTEIPWNAPMQVTHPVIAMNLYRLKDGKFEQVGWSWLKHGFFATNSNGCVGGCISAGTGSRLGVNCSDTYGVSNNSDQFYLGGRDEVNPLTGVWTCERSWFSNYVNDCMRRNNGSGLTAVDHRLEVLDADLSNAGARYFYEAFYINQNEANTYNQVASREAAITWNGSAYSINNNLGSFSLGPAINRWGEQRSTAQPQTQGDVIVAVQTTSLGGGMFRYDYAVYNHTLDRQIREFTIPLPAGAQVQNVEFRDIDQVATNQWTHVINDSFIRWSTAEFGSSTANPLKYSSVFNFRFDANVPPASSSSTLGLFKPGTGTTLSAAVKGPLVLSPIEAYELVNSGKFAGNLDSLADSDNDKLVFGPVDSGARGGSGLIGTITAPAGAISSLVVGVEFQNSLQAGANPRQQIHLFNWNTQAWELIDTSTTTAADQFKAITVSNAGRFVHASTRAVRVRVMHDSDLGVTANRWTAGIDVLGVHFN